MDKEKSVKLREGLEVIAKIMNNEIKTLETKIINWRDTLRETLEGDTLQALSIEGVLYYNDTLEIGLRLLER